MYHLCAFPSVPNLFPVLQVLSGNAPYQPRISRINYTEKPIIIPLEPAKQLQDPRQQH